MKLEVDSALCWLQAVSAFLFHAVFFGVVFSFGIFYVALLQEFPGQESEAAWISGINFGFVMLTSPLTIKLLNYMPARVVSCAGTLLASLALYLSSKASTIWVLYMTFGVMHGMGTNLCYISAVWVLRKNFQKQRDYAFGLASAGSGAGGILYGIVLPIFVESRGWRGAMEIVSYITLSFVIVSIVMVPVKQKSEKDAKQEKKKLLSWKPKLKTIRFSIPSPWRNRAFVVLSITILLCAFVSSVPYCHIVNYAIHQGVRRSEGARLPLFISTGSLIGRIVVGRISGFRGVSRITLCQITFLVECLATTLCTLATNNASLVAFSLVFGVFDGAFSLLLAIVVDDVFLDKNQAMKAIGQLFQMLAVPYAFGAPLAGWLYIQTGSYHVPFFMCGAILFIAACLISLVRYFLQAALSTSALTLPEKIVISPADESAGDLVPVLHRTSNRLISSRTCSFIDLAVEVYGENRYKSSTNLAVYSEHSLGTRNMKNSKICSQDFLRADDSVAIYREGNEYECTDITNQISGRIKTGNTGIIETGDACSSINQNEGYLQEIDNNDVKVLDGHVSNNNDVIVLDGHVSDTSSVDYGDNGSSGLSIDDAGYFSAAAPANYADSDTQSATSQCGVSMCMESQKGSLDSFMEIDFIENEEVEDNNGFCVNIEDFGHVGKLEKMGRVYE